MSNIGTWLYLEVFYFYFNQNPITFYCGITEMELFYISF